MARLARHLRETPWQRLLRAHAQGQRVDRSDILDLLHSDESVPDEAKPLLASTIEGSMTFPSGTKPLTVERWEKRWWAHDMVKRYESLIEDPARMPNEIDPSLRKAIESYAKEAASAIRGKRTPLEMAVQLVADMIGIKPGTLKKWRQKTMPR